MPPLPALTLLDLVRRNISGGARGKGSITVTLGASSLEA